MPLTLVSLVKYFNILYQFAFKWTIFLKIIFIIIFVHLLIGFLIDYNT